MSFQVKDTLSIVASIVNYMRATQDKVTDFNVGSVARTLIEAPAIEIDELYQMMFRGLKESIPVSVYNSFSFDLLEAIAASGALRYSLQAPSASDIAIPAGTVAKQPGGSNRYTTAVDVVIQAGELFVDVLAYCDNTGTSTNAVAGTITEQQTPISGVSVTNQNAFSNGRDLETDEERKSRFRDYISTISRGTLSALMYGAGTAAVVDATGDAIERVAYVSIVEPYLVDPVVYPTALVYVYVHNGSGGTSADLVSAVQTVIDGYEALDGTLVPGWKAAGVKVDVFAATEVFVDVTATIQVRSTHNLVTATEQAIADVSAYLGGLGIGVESVHAEIVSLIMAVPGVYNCSVSLPVGDVVVASNEKIMAGTVAIA